MFGVGVAPADGCGDGGVLFGVGAAVGGPGADFGVPVRGEVVRHHVQLLLGAGVPQVLEQAEELAPPFTCADPAGDLVHADRPDEHTRPMPHDHLQDQDLETVCRPPVNTSITRPTPRDKPLGTVSRAS
ncbi:hypothetical protein [Streptomyces antibioticus]|uniref:hypothetical protein n=1 Tax=Streptomyces antibioticus TaxID=1890 RepID=UPI0033A03FBE